MAKIFQIPGKFSVNLLDLSMVKYEQDDNCICLEWKDPNKTTSMISPTTKEEFEQLQKALANK